MPTYDDHLTSARAELSALLTYAVERQADAERDERPELARLWNERARCVSNAHSALDAIPALGSVLAELGEQIATGSGPTRAQINAETEEAREVIARRHAARAAVTGEQPGSVTVKIENAYSDGHTSTTTVDVEPPDDTTIGADLDDWWSETVYEHTGDGHGADSDLGSCYTATVTGVQHQHDNNLAWMLGETFEWAD